MRNLTDAIKYNRSISLGAIHDDPTTFLLHDVLFDDFRIVTGEAQQWLHDLPLKAVVSDVGTDEIGRAHV